MHSHSVGFVMRWLINHAVKSSVRSSGYHGAKPLDVNFKQDSINKGKENVIFKTFKVSSLKDIELHLCSFMKYFYYFLNHR